MDKLHRLKEAGEHVYKAIRILKSDWPALGAKLEVALNSIMRSYDYLERRG